MTTTPEAQSAPTTAIAIAEKVPSYITTATERFGADRLRLLRDTIAAKLTLAELGLFLAVCDRTGLDPFARQIYPVKRNDRKLGREVMTIQTGIDGFRSIAERTNQYRGQNGPWWCGDDGVWKDVWLSDKPPVAAKIEVLRGDFQQPLVGVALWREYAQIHKDGYPLGLWGTFQTVMLAKCAESIALRRAFPQQLSGLYSSEEMPVIDMNTMPADPGVAAAAQVTTEELRKELEAPVLADKVPKASEQRAAITAEVVEPAPLARPLPSNAEEQPAEAGEATAAPPEVPAAPAKPKAKSSGASATKVIIAVLNDVDACVTAQEVVKKLAEHKAAIDSLPRGQEAVFAYVERARARLCDEKVSEEEEELAESLKMLRPQPAKKEATKEA